MKIEEYPDMVDYKYEYTAHDIAILLRCSHRTACTRMDAGVIPCRRNPAGRRERLVKHEAIESLARSGGAYSGILSKIRGIPGG